MSILPYLLPVACLWSTRIEAIIVLQIVTTSIEWGHATHTGRRPANEDALHVPSALTDDIGRGRLFAVADGRTMVLMPATGDDPAFYSDRTPVTFHHYAEFLNQVADRLSVNEGIVKKGDEIWLYLGSGSEPHEQIIYDHGRFHLRDASWAGRPVVRVTWLGAMAYARQYGKAMPSLSQWQTILSQPETASITPSLSAQVAPAQPDPHSQMMDAGTVGQPSAAIDPLTGTAIKPTKE